MRQVAQLEGFALTINYGWLGGMALEKLGSTFPPETSQQCEGSDGIVFGAVSQGGLLELRRHFDFFINLRPIRSCPGLLHTSSLRPEKVQNLDILIVRELVSGIYFGAGKGIANPLGTLAGCVLMLQQWGEIKAAQRILNAQERLLGKGYRTADLSPQNHETLVNTATLVDLFLEEISLEQLTQ
ncbi:isocitrate/isopropylmalate family dehydrogenase [Planktothrix agardhii]|uniref:isocitrate/isopropylmalate family dehydrogenase n=1 Tax=Planktothrix agardhii TaxID=1160 RepID=UPI001F45C29B|nr:isocitrate/isopropylmalate family dehydrogenase [Planktothrix agardhii]MCF3622135.1 isocitrate/isopropylmalate family dehydrogenase [Planktothrix agardhii 1030]